MYIIPNMKIRTNIPTDYTAEIFATDPQFPRAIIRAIEKKEDEEIESFSEGIIEIQNKYPLFTFT